MEGNREYKSDVFSMLMEEPENVLDVYNALNGTSYNDPEQVIIKKTGEKSFKLSVRNDASFLIDSELSIYEHQSTKSSNMPLRQLIYVTELYKDSVDERNIYSGKQVKIPTPHFVVFYNGQKNWSEQEVQKLSDAYMKPTDHPELELLCTMYNINPGNSENLKEKSTVLSDYTEFVERVRENHKTMGLEDALDAAIESCIQDGILKDFLKRRKSEVKNVAALDYTFERRIELNEKEHRREMQAMREENDKKDKRIKLVEEENKEKDKQIRLVEEENEKMREENEYLKRLLEEKNRNN